MNLFLSSLKKGKITLFIITLTISLIGFLIAYNFCKDQALIKFDFKYVENIEINPSTIISTESINKVKDVEYSYFTGSKISTYSKVDIKNISIKQNNDTYTILIDKSSFEIDGEYKDSVAKGFLKHLTIISLDDSLYQKYDQYTETTTNSKGYDVTILGISKIFDNDYYEANSLTNNQLNSTTDNYRLKMCLIYSLIGLGIGLVIGFTTIILLTKYNKINQLNYNEYISIHPFKSSIFVESFKNLKNIRCLVTISILLGFVMVFKFIPIPTGFGSLGITFGFLFLAIACMIYGPTSAILIGTLSDLIGFLIKPDGPYFFGYTLNAILACFTYGMCFYKTHITFTRCLVARSIVNLLVNGLLGSIWHIMLYGLPFDSLFTYMMLTSIPKNIAFLIPQSLLLFLILKGVVPILRNTNHINSEIKVSIF